MDPYLEHPALWPDVHNIPFMVRQPIPVFPLPLLHEDEAPMVDLGAILHFDLRLDYAQPPVPPLPDEDVAWARQLLAKET